ncbi:MAG TPA: magnesium transporter [Candidatus Nitrosotenuis sp.]|nr:magnesium transporter [Candidatus Nitrosotenuis sp.]
MVKKNIQPNEKNNHEHLVDTKITRKFLSFLPTMTVEKIEEILDVKAREFETIGYVYVVDENGVLVGVVSLKQVLQAPIGTMLKDMMNTNVISVKYHSHQERAVYLALKHGLKSIPVVDREHRLIGVLPHKAILSIFNHEFRKDIFQSGGISHAKEIESIDTSLSKLVKVRFPSLFLGLVGGLVAAMIVTNFERLLNSYIVLASFIPVIVYLTDAVGTQSQTLVVRLLAVEPGFSKLRYMIREIKIGVILGAVFAIMLFVAEILGWRQIKLGTIIGVAIFFSMVFQAFFATYFVIMLDKLKKDPAIASGPLATIISDITTIAIYFGVAILILEFV